MKYIKKFEQDKFECRKKVSVLVEQLEGLLVELTDKNYHFLIRRYLGNAHIDNIRNKTSFNYRIGDIYDDIKRVEDYAIHNKYVISYDVYFEEETIQSNDILFSIDDIDEDLDIIEIYIKIEIPYL